MLRPGSSGEVGADPASGCSDIDEEILADWQPASFDPDGNTVVVDATATDAHVTTAMSAAALDQRFRWKARHDTAGRAEGRTTNRGRPRRRLIVGSSPIGDVSRGSS